MPTTNEFDIATYILEKEGEMSAMKLQKLLYYAQAWSLVWDEEELFESDFQAWANGPVLPSIYNVHRGEFKVNKDLFKRDKITILSQESSETVDAVLKAYGDKTAQWLSNLTHEESPWKDARKGLDPRERSTDSIDKGAIHLFYSGL